jgi:hypothetical protein
LKRGRNGDCEDEPDSIQNSKFKIQNSLLLMTNASATSAADSLRDIRPPIDIPNGWEWVWWTLAVLVPVALAYLMWRYWQKRKEQLAFVPPVPAHVRARQKLEEALALLAQPKPFCTMVSDTVRFYLEERFNFHAPERTTEEFLYELQNTNLLLPDQKTSLGEFLTGCDLVKFARYEPGEPELRDLHASAMRLVDETEPVVLPENQMEPPPAGDSALRIPHSALE